MFSKLQSMKLTRKLLLIAGLLVVPMITLLFFFWTASQEKIGTARKELVGTQFYSPLRRVAEAMALHRGAQFAVLSGDGQFRGRLADSAQRADSAIAEVDETIARTGDKLKTKDEWNNVKTKWSILRGQSGGSAADSLAQHTNLLNEVVDHVRLVSDRSTLTLDPTIDTYYLWDTVANGLFPSIESIALVQGAGSGAIAKGAIKAEDAVRMQLLGQQAQQHSKVASRGFAKISEYTPALRGVLESSYRDADRATETFVNTSMRDVARVGESGIDAGAHFERGAAAIESNARYFDVALKALDDRLNTYISEWSRQQWLQLTLALAILALAGALVYFITQGITRQVGSLNRMFGALGLGDFSARAEVSSQDELGNLAASFNAMLENQSNLLQSREERDHIQASIMKLLDEVSGVAQGDLTKEAEVTADVTGAIADSFNYMIAELRQVISRVQKTTAEVNTSANEVQKTASDLATGSQAQSQQVMQASAAITDMLQSIRQVSRSATEATQVASQALDSARTGSETVNKTIAGMNQIRTQVQETSKRIKRLGESSQEIGEIVQLIGDIADRTSILALNASIQAAMAGEAGRGFAVVAEEVERLAERATESTKKIAALIKSVQGDTTEAIAAMEETTREVVGGSKLANEAGQRLSEIEKVSKQISDLVQAISAASKDQAEGSEAVSRNVTGISEFTRQTAEGASVAEVSIRRLSRLANELDESVRRFRLPQAA